MNREIRNKSFRKDLARDPRRRRSSFRQRCSLLVNERRARFYILRRCVIMLICWHDYSDP